jgi:hypothetical protein
MIGRAIGRAPDPHFKLTVTEHDDIGITSSANQELS